MRVLVFPKDFPSEQHPQAGVFVLRDVKALRALGHQVEVLRVVPYAPPVLPKWRAYGAIPDRETLDGIPVRTIRALLPPRMIGMEYVGAQVHAAVQREIERFRPDVIHAHFLIPSGHAAVRHSVPVVVTAHGSDAYAWPRRRAGLYRAAQETIRRATEVTAVSGFIADCVRGIEQREVHVVYNGADQGIFTERDPLRSRAELELPPDRVILAYAGNVLRSKGLFDLVEALRRIPAAERPLLALAGSGPDEAELRHAAERAGIESRFLGRLQGEGVARLFGAADIVTLPSHNEGLPNVVCEAMCARRAVLATAVGGIPEIVNDGVTGALVPPHDVERLSASLRRLTADAPMRARIAAAASAFASQHLTALVSSRRYEDIYLQATRGRRAQRGKDPIMGDCGPLRDGALTQ